MKVSKVKLTDSLLADLRPGRKPGTKAGLPAVKYCIWDSACPGFGVVVKPTGGKFLVVKTCRDGIRAWQTLGRWPGLNVEDGRAKATALKDQVRQGEDPKALIEAKKAEAAKKRLRLTMDELCDRFIREHIQAEVTREGGKLKVSKTGGAKEGNKLSTAIEHVRLIERLIRPCLGKLVVAEVGTAEISAMLFKIRKATPVQANRVRSVLGKMFKRAELWGLRPAGSSPVPAQDRAKERKKERNLSDHEIIRLGEALRAAEDPAAGADHEKQKDGPRQEDPFALAALRLAVLAGMRKAEIIGDHYRGMPALTWDDVDFEAGVLWVHHKTETRTGKKRIVHLCAAARKLLEALPHQLGNPHVIPGEKAGQALVNLQLVWDRIRDAVTEKAKQDAKEAGRKKPEVDISDVTLHDLRRTFASVAARMGYPELWIAALLGHSAGTVTQGYARVGQDPLREAVEAIGGRIAGLLSGDIDPEKEAEERRQAKEKAAKTSGGA
jgi:integrase